MKYTEDLSLEMAMQDGSQNLQRNQAVTAVQVAPIKTPADIVDAIRRQKKTIGIGYNKGNGHNNGNSASNARPVFRAILSGAIQPGSDQASIATQAAQSFVQQAQRYSKNGRNANVKVPCGANRGRVDFTTAARANAYLINNGSSRAVLKNSNQNDLNVGGNAGYGNIQFLKPAGGQCIPLSSSVQNPSKQVNVNSYSVVYNKLGKHVVINTGGTSNNNQTDTKGLNSHSSQSGATVTSPGRGSPRLAFTHRSKAQSMSDYPDGFNRLSGEIAMLLPKENSENCFSDKKSMSLDSDIEKQTNFSKDSDLRISFEIDSRNSYGNTLRVPKTVRNESPQLSEREGARNGLAIKSRSPSSPRSPRLPKSKAGSDRCSVSSPMQAAPKIEQMSSSAASPSLSFADSVIGAVRSDLTQVYQLYNAKLTYADIIEKSQPHRLGDLVYDENGNLTFQDVDSQFPTLGLNLSQNFLRRSLSPLPPSLSRSSPSLSSPAPLSPIPWKKSLPKHLPDLPAQSKQPPTLIPPVFRPSSFSSGTASQSTTLSPNTHSSQGRTEIDYHKPITIIIETDNNDDLSKSTRPILKSPTKNEFVDSSNNGNSFSRFRSSGNENESSVPSYLQAVHQRGKGTKQGGIQFSVGRSSDHETQENSKDSKDKGRLVRFSSSHKIHEFAPTEPVNPKTTI